MNTCSIYTMVLPDHTATMMVDFFFSPSKINGMSRRITIYESTPKKLDPSQNSTHAVQCSSTAPADWEEVLSSVMGLHSNLLTSRIALTPPFSPEHDTQLKMDFQWVIITVNNLKQRHHRDAPELHILPFHGFPNFLGKSDLEQKLQLKRTSTTAKAE